MSTLMKKAQELADHLADEGKLIEGGWIGLQMMAYPRGAPLEQLNEMRQIFFAGAQHLFSSILNILDPEKEPTAKDLNRLNLIQGELDEFIANFKANISTEGNA